MKDTFLRSVSFWKSACISMPDNSFFELLRSVFGKIKTPFNKQQLLNDLEKFLLREDIQKTIAAYIDEKDAKIIAAIALFGEPAPDQLESFFSSDYSYTQLQDIIVNMEERFIVYRFIEEKSYPFCSRLALNPLLKNILMPFTTDISNLFPSFNSSNKKDISQDRKIIFNDLLLAGMISFSSQWQPFYKSEGIRKKVIEAGKVCFPEIDLNKIIGSLLMLGLFYIYNDNLFFDKKRIDEFSSLSECERKEYYAASLSIYKEIFPEKLSNHTEILPPLYRNRIRETVNLTHSVFNALNTDKQYPEETLKRIIEIIKSQNLIKINTAVLIDSMEKTGLIEPCCSGAKTTDNTVKNKKTLFKTNTRNKTTDNEITQTVDAHTVSNAVIAFDSGFSILVYPEINFKDAIKLSTFMNLKEFSSKAHTVSRFELDRDSVIRAFNNNINTDEIISLLDRLSGKKTDDTLIWNLKDWEKRYGEVSLNKGVILKLSEEHRYLTETTPLSELIIETLAPGLYLLDENATEEVTEALRNTGIDIIAQQHKTHIIKKRENEKHSLHIYNKNFPTPSSFALKDIFPIDESSTTDKNNGSNIQPTADQQTKIFHAILKNLPMSDSERKELSARIERRLVLCEMQLKETDIRYEKTEARHMDYSGKQNIAKQAISQQSPVEIVWIKQQRTQLKQNNETIDEDKIYGIPKALEKEGNELFLVIIPETKDNIQQTPQQEVLRIPLAKISLLRRIKKSIFEK